MNYLTLKGGYISPPRGLVYFDYLSEKNVDDLQKTDYLMGKRTVMKEYFAGDRR